MAFSSSYSSYASSQNGTWAWKDSYRWVDFDAEASRQVDQELTNRWNNTKDRTFSFALNAGDWFNQYRNRGIYTCHVELTYNRKEIKKIYQKNKNTSYQREMRRTPAFQLPSGNKKQLGKIFDKNYADKEEKDIMSEAGMLTFFKKDLNINPESHETLIVSFILNCEEMGIISRDEFIDGFVKNGCNDKNDIKKCVQNKCRDINGNTKKWREFYKWIFKHVKEDEKKKTIPCELAVQLWSILFQKDKNKMKLFDKWIKYCQTSKDMKVISRDLWEQLYDFLKETTSIDDYDDAGGSWPVAIDVKYILPIPSLII